jgi:hypothetical protein
MPDKTKRTVIARAKNQHGVIARRQLVALDLSAGAITRMVAGAFLHPLFRGVYAVGRPELTREGRWMAATLTCNGVLSHSSAAALWEIGRDGPAIEVTIAAHRRCRDTGLIVHRRTSFETTRRHGIPVTPPCRR